MYIYTHTYIYTYIHVYVYTHKHTHPYAVEILTKVAPNSSTIRNNAGGHYNHMLFWTILTNETKNKQPTDVFLNAVNA